MGGAQFVTLERARHVEILARDPSQPARPKSYYFGDDGIASTGPQAVRISYEAHHGLGAHFHHVDQFQIFFGACDTTFQRHLTGPLLVHYADADSAYGPFSAGEEPFSFMTLRARGSDFTGHLPEQRPELRRGRRRQFHRDLRAFLAAPPAGEATNECVIGPYPDGLAAFAVAAPAGAAIPVPRGEGSGGQYHVVVAGELVTGGEALPELTVGWVGAGDAAPPLAAGAMGVHLLVLQFPVQAG